MYVLPDVSSTVLQRADTSWSLQWLNLLAGTLGFNSGEQNNENSRHMIVHLVTPLTECTSPVPTDAIHHHFSISLLVLASHLPVSKAAWQYCKL